MHRFLLFPKFKYPKFLILLLTYFLAYLLVANKNLPYIGNFFTDLGYLGILIAGVMYSNGFTSGPATAILLILADSVDPFSAAMLAGIGSLLGDFAIFEFIRLGFQDEIKKLSHEKLFRKINLHEWVKKIAYPVIACLFIASPLPDEIGISMLAASKIPGRNFAMLSYLLNTVGVYAILIIGAY
jgi:uncharacterized membrane protein YdjX (TVP38/TMEM64 family)